MKDKIVFEVKLDPQDFKWERYHTEKIKRVIKATIKEYIFEAFELRSRVIVK